MLIITPCCIRNKKYDDQAHVDAYLNKFQVKQKLNLPHNLVWESCSPKVMECKLRLVKLAYPSVVLMCMYGHCILSCLQCVEPLDAGQ